MTSLQVLDACKASSGLYFKHIVCKIISIEHNGLITLIHSQDIGIDIKDFEKNGKLIFTHVLYRHGDRTPMEQAPGDKYDVSFWPDGWGQLTDALLDGLYPPKGNQVNRQHIPVHTNPKKLDYLIPSDFHHHCKAYLNAYNAHLESAEIKKYQEEIRPIYDYLTEKTGTEINSIEDVWLIRDSWLCESIHNLRLYPNNELFYQIEKKFFLLDTATKFLTKIRSGFLIKDTPAKQMMHLYRTEKCGFAVPTTLLYSVY